MPGMARAHQATAAALVVVLAVVCSVSDVLVVMADAAPALCNVTQDGLAACKPAVTAPNPAAPGKACCDAMAKADLPCLCSYKNSSVLPLMGIDPALAMQLPAKCNIPPPPTC